MSFATDSVLTSLLVMGASPRVNASSGMEMELRVSGVGFTMSATQRSPKLSSRHSEGLPVKMLSVGYPKSCPTVTDTLLRLYSNSCLHMSWTESCPDSRVNTFARVPTRLTMLESLPWLLVR